MHNFLKEARVTLALGAVAAGTTTQEGGVIDMGSGGGFDAVVAIASLGDVTATSVLQLSWRESDASDGSDDTLVAGSATTEFTAGASDADSKLLISDCAKRTKRYVFPQLTRTTANAVVNSIIAIQYKAKAVPVTQPSGVIASVLTTG
jgi:hypothetical protein